jgi:putative membrane protein
MFAVPWALLGVQFAFVIGSLAGYGIFTARPDLLAALGPDAVRFYAWAFHGFAVWNMTLGGLAVLSEAFLRNRMRGVAIAFAVVYAASLASELAGTTYGIPFGAYSYAELLGPKWLGRVPLVIPLSWFTMAWPAWIIGRRRYRGWGAVVAGAALLVAWDLALDPAMSSITRYWVWAEQGAYYGMPLNNLFGWSVTGMVLLAALYQVQPAPDGSATFAVSAYAVNLALPLSFCVLGGYWLAVAAGGVSLAAALLLTRSYRRPAVAAPEDRRHPSLIEKTALKQRSA